MLYQGELAALATAACWVVTAMSFEAAGKRIGSLAVNIIRLAIAFVFLAILGWATRGLPLPTDAGGHAWLWLSLSGLIGFTFGDLTLFRAFVLIGSRLSTLLMALVPPITTLIGWALLGEVLTLADYAGMTLTLAGVALAVLERRPDANGLPAHPPRIGILLGVCGAFGQAVGLVLSKYGMREYSPFAATHIRVIAGLIGFAAIYTIIGWWPKVVAGLRDAPAMKRVAVGSFFGPFLGVSMSLMAVQHAKAGVAATIMALTPVLILAPSALIFHERITARAAAGALLAVGGVALLILV